MRELVGLLAAHPDEFSYDWRTRFSLPVAAIFDGRMSWTEAVSLTKVLLGDPSSRVGAAVQEWDYPVTKESAILMDTLDVLMLANTPDKQRHKLKPYSRPWKQADESRSAAPAVDQETVRRVLTARGH